MVQGGKLSAGEVQDAAGTIVSSKYSDEDPLLERLSRAGRVIDSKPSNKNMSRDVTRSFLRNTEYPQTYRTSITLWDADMDRQVTDQIDYLLPYEVMDYPIGDKSDLAPFTSLPTNSPFVDEKTQWMNEYNIPGDGSGVLVCGLWGDAAPFHTRDSILMLIFNVISGVCNERRSMSKQSKARQGKAKQSKAKQSKANKIKRQWCFWCRLPCRCPPFFSFCDFVILCSALFCVLLSREQYTKQSLMRGGGSECGRNACAASVAALADAHLIRSSGS